ncbi:pyridoxamine 5'-phosphate oxidase family protein [Propionibacterium sp.]|uniref:pyridoxamine 5'-phosphate oxidase family protein n=1 Tax=Propionibacterium sp. TaxID=1977903 RepID=UPI0039EA6869
MTQIAYTQRVCDDQAAIGSFLESQRIGVLGLETPDGPYAVPVNFLWHRGAIYFHGMGSGRKVDVLRGGPRACFTVFHEDGTVTDPMPCHADTAYTSVLVFGDAEEISDPAESAEILQLLVEKFLPGQYNNRLTGKLVENYRSGMDNRPVAVFKISPTQITAKQNRADQADIFEPQA